MHAMLHDDRQERAEAAIAYASNTPQLQLSTKAAEGWLKTPASAKH